MIGRLFKRTGVEDREASTVSTNGALGTTVPKSDATAVAQAAASLWERAFMAGEGDLPPSMLASIGRTLYRRGEVVLIQRGREVLQAASWDVQGGVERRTWLYDLQLPAPSGSAMIRGVSGQQVAHIRINSRPEEPWRGRGPLQVASLTAGLLARIETALEHEERVPVGQILAIPSVAQADTLADQVAALKGNIVLGESTAGGWDTGIGQNRGGAPEWRPTRIGPEPTQHQITLRKDVALTILAASGVPGGLVYPDTGSDAREAWRRFLHATIAPIGRLVSDELRRAFGRPYPLDWSGLFASDLQGRARAYKQLTEAGVSDADARRICGFDG